VCAFAGETRTSAGDGHKGKSRALAAKRLGNAQTPEAHKERHERRA